jgi:hypothetical protein
MRACSFRHSAARLNSSLCGYTSSALRRRRDFSYNSVTESCGPRDGERITCNSASVAVQFTGNNKEQTQE